MAWKKRRRARPADADARTDLVAERLQVERQADAELERSSYWRIIYVVLAVIIIVSAAAAIRFPDTPIVDNLATEALGILVTVAFVQRFLEYQDRARRMRASVGALRKASAALDRFITTWAATLKGVHRPMRAQPVTLNGLFADHVTEDLRYCNPFAERGGEDGASERWIEWTVHRLLAAQRSLGSIIVTYGASLDPAYVEVLDEIVDDPFLEVLAELIAQPPDARVWRIRLNTARALREAHFERLLRTIRLHNRLATEAAAVRTRSGAPRSSALGVGLSLDADLRVDTDVDVLWAAPPEAGALRVSGPG